MTLDTQISFHSMQRNADQVGGTLGYMASAAFGRSSEQTSCPCSYINDWILQQENEKTTKKTIKHIFHI